MADVFISYSRRDSEFVRRLVSDLEACDKSVWVDTEGIADAEVFPDAIRSAIEGSDAFVFVITPESAASAFCEQEVEHAVALSKRIVPVLREAVADDALPEAIRIRNWIPYAPDADGTAASARLVAALDTDLDYVRAHTRWLVKALEWEEKGRDRSLLLRGSELASAEGWLAGVGETADPAPVAVQREYVHASRAAADRRQRRILVASLLAVLVAVALAVGALISRSQAVSARANAQSRALAATSNAQLAIDPERSLLLAMEAVRQQDTPEAVYALRRALDLSPIRKRLPGVGDQSVGGGFLPNAAYRPDGREIAQGSWNGTVQLVDAATMEVRRRIRLGGVAPFVAYDPTGSLLAVSTDAGVALLDARTGRRQSTLDGIRFSVGLQFSPDGKRLAALSALSPSGDESEIAVVDVKTRRQLTFPLGPVGRVSGTNYALSIGFSPDGRRLLVGSPNGIGIFDAQTGRLLTSALTGEQVTHAEFSPDGSLIAATRKSRPDAQIKRFRVELLDAHTLRRRSTVYRSDDPSQALRWTAFSPDGKRLAFVAGHSLGIYSLETRRSAYLTSVGAPFLAGGGFSPDGREFAFMAGDGSGAVYRADTVEKAVIDAGAIDPGLTGDTLALARDTVVAAIAPLRGAMSRKEIVRMWSWRGANLGRPLVVSDDNCRAFGVDTTARLAYTGQTRTGCSTGLDIRPVRIWNLERRRVATASDPTGAGDVDTPSLSRDGAWLLEQLEGDGDGGDLRLLNTADGQTTFVGGSRCFFGEHAVSDDGATVAAVEQCGGGLTTWKITPSGPVARRLPVAVLSSSGPLRFSPDATRIAVANINGRGDVGIVDATSGRTLVTLTGHSENIVTLAYSSDGTLLVTGSRDGTARVWDAKRGWLLRTLDHGAPVRGVAFSPDRHAIATMDVTGLIRLWDACTDCENPDALMKLAKARVTRGLTASERTTYLG